MLNFKNGAIATQEASSSPLVRSIFGGAVLLIVLELASITVLVCNILEAEKSAAKEYKVLKTSEQLSHLAELMRHHCRVFDDWVENGHDPSKLIEHDQSCKNIESSLEKLTQSWREAGRDNDELIPLSDGYRIVLNDTKMSIAAPNEKDLNRFYKKSINDTKELYPRARVLMDKINESMEQEDRKAKKRKQSPLPVLIFASCSNFLLCVLAVWWINQKIATPISQLAADCKELAKGDAIAAPKTISTDVDSLRLVFHKMSAEIAANEQNRKGYLRMLKGMQSQSLEHAKSSMNTLLQTSSFSDAGKRKLKQITLNLESMSQLLESMREGLSFNEHEKLVIKYANVESKTIAETAELAVGALLQQKNVQLKTKLFNFPIEADIHLLGRVAINLLSNAIKFSPIGSEIQFSILENNGRLRCEVHDRGVGISPTDRERLFKKFSQLDSSAKRSGSGLGLMICKQIIEAHGGTIACESEPGQGTCFWFEIPSKAFNAVDIPDKETSVAITRRQSGSIRDSFGALIIVFLICQVIVSFALGTTFSLASSKARDYSREKHTLIKTERLMSFFMDFRKLVQAAYRKHNFQAFISVYPLLQKQLDLTHELATKSNNNELLKQDLEKIEKELTVLQTEAKAAIAQYPDVDEEYLNHAFSKGDRITVALEDLLFEVLKLENSDLDASYNLGAELRFRIISLLAICTVANIGLTIALTISALRILKRIQALVEKTHEFATGGRPTADIRGNDELSRLDESFCEVASLIREAELQRQELLSVINHDLRTPLGSVLTTIELINAGRFGDLDYQTSAILESCEKKLRELLRQLNNLLTLEQAELGALSPDLSEQNLTALLDELSTECKRIFQDKNIRLQIECSDEDAFETKGESFLLKRALEALLENAMQVAPDNSAVQVKLSRRQGRILLQVTDSGKGIAPELQSKIFDRFRTVDGQAIAGMGLPLAYRLLNLQAAELKLESSNSDGTTFLCSFLESTGKRT